MAKKRTLIPKLYWVTTADHDEDWFVFAPSSTQAESFHEDFEGYNSGDATAELILKSTKKRVGECPRHAQLEDLVAHGFEVLNANPNARGVRFKERAFLEGHLEAMVIEADELQKEALGLKPPRNRRREEN